MGRERCVIKISCDGALVIDAGCQCSSRAFRVEDGYDAVTIAHKPAWGACRRIGKVPGHDSQVVDAGRECTRRARGIENLEPAVFVPDKAAIRV